MSGQGNPGIAKTYILNNGANPSVGLYVGNGMPFGRAKLELDGPAATHIWVAENTIRVFSVTSGGRVDVASNVYANDVCTTGGKCLSAAGRGNASGGLYGHCERNDYGPACGSAKAPASCSGTNCACPGGYTLVRTGQADIYEYDTYREALTTSYYSCYKN